MILDAYRKAVNKRRSAYEKLTKIQEKDVYIIYQVPLLSIN